MQNTHDIDDLAAGLVDLLGFLNSPRRDEALLREAGVELDRALFALLVAIAARGPLDVAGIADLVGRDHTTVSRQLPKLESLGLIVRRPDMRDRRHSVSQVTKEGRGVVRAIAAARRRLLTRALADWSAADRAALARLVRRFADTLAAYAADKA